MARTVNEEAYATRRNAILDAAQKLIYTKGYEQMTIQDLLDTLQISKGAFYHYFDSKPALLEALIERTIVEAEAVMLPIVRDPHLRALVKLQQLFTTISRWKTMQKSYLLAMMTAFYSDENAIFRQKARLSGIQMMSPLLAEVIRQGIAEGDLHVAYPDLVGDIVMSLLLGLSEALIERLLATPPRPDGTRLFQPAALERALAAYCDALERVLGAPPGSLPMMDVETLHAWEVSETNST